MVIMIKPPVILFYVLVLAIVATAALFLIVPESTNATEAFAEGGRVLIIDPGHGGADGGAVSRSGAYESAINLSISLKMRELAVLTATPCIMTRESEEISYPAEANTISKKKVFDQKQRVALINDTPGALLISVHQNEYPTSQPRGPQAFYGKAEGSDEFAKILQERLNAALYPQNRRVAAPVPSSVYLFKQTGCVAVLAECGFLSNGEESKLLEDGGHQLKAAIAIMSAYFQFTDT